MPNEATDAVETLVGVIERVTFHAPDTGFTVLKVKVRGRPQPVAVVGSAPAAAAGETLTAEGAWVNDRVHGLQFRAERMVVAPPASRDGIERYLASGAIKGVGIQTAHKIVARFGKRTFEILDGEPERLAEIPGLSPARVKRIIESWNEDRVVREIGVFLQDHGLGPGQANRVYRALGSKAVAILRDDPYRLARDVAGIGFRTADDVARRLSIPPDAPERLRAGVAFMLLQARDDGHCAMPRERAVEAASALLEVDASLIEAALSRDLLAGGLVADEIDGEACLFLPDLHRAEKDIGARLRALMAGAPPWGADAASDDAIAEVEARTGRRLSPSQRQALAMALGAKVSVITGGPGVGKTALLDAILRVLSRRDAKVVLAAPTGRAAKRMTEQTGFEAKTIHRLLEIDPARQVSLRGRDILADIDLLVVDEASMVDAPMMLAIVEAIPAGAGLILIGDVDQLPPVGPGQPLADIIASGAAPVARLTEVFRQAKDSQIIDNAYRINRGEAPESAAAPDGEFFIIEMRSPEDGLAKALEIVAERAPKRFGLDPMRDIQVLCPMNKGLLGARNLNIELQKLLNPPKGRALERFGWTFAPGDKVMQTSNDYDRDVFNGDIGLVLRLDEEAGEMTVAFDGRPVIYAYSEVEALMPAYAITIHKSQGSEYPAVVIPLAMQHYPMLARNLIYTAVTRGRRLVVLVVERRALGLAVGKARADQRLTKLRRWLSGS